MFFTGTDMEVQQQVETYLNTALTVKTNKPKPNKPQISVNLKVFIFEKKGALALLHGWARSIVMRTLLDKNTAENCFTHYWGERVVPVTSDRGHSICSVLENSHLLLVYQEGIQLIEPLCHLATSHPFFGRYQWFTVSLHLFGCGCITIQTEPAFRFSKVKTGPHILLKEERRYQG